MFCQTFMDFTKRSHDESLIDWLSLGAEDRALSWKANNEFCWLYLNRDRSNAIEDNEWAHLNCCVSDTFPNAPSDSLTKNFHQERSSSFHQNLMTKSDSDQSVIQTLYIEINQISCSNSRPMYIGREWYMYHKFIKLEVLIWNLSIEPVNRLSN